VIARCRWKFRPGDKQAVNLCFDVERRRDDFSEFAVNVSTIKHFVFVKHR